MDSIGLFAYIHRGQSSRIQNIALQGFDVRGKDNVGGLVIYNGLARINNSYARGFVSGLKYIDGLVEYNGLAGQAVEGYLDDENKNRILFSPPADAASGEYRITVTATYPNDRTSSASFVLNVVEPKAVITTLTETSTLNTATWSAESSSGVGLRYPWTWDKKPDGATALSDETNETLLNYTPNQDGIYQLKLTVTDETNDSSSHVWHLASSVAKR